MFELIEGDWSLFGGPKKCTLYKFHQQILAWVRPPPTPFFLAKPRFWRFLLLEPLPLLGTIYIYRIAAFKILHICEKCVDKKYCRKQLPRWSCWPLLCILPSAEAYFGSVFRASWLSIAFFYLSLVAFATFYLHRASKDKIWINCTKRCRQNRNTYLLLLFSI